MRFLVGFLFSLWGVGLIAQEPCELLYDGNGDGAVGSADLVALLGEYGLSCAPPLGFSCGDTLAFQGHAYPTVEIGGHCWFSQNLRSEAYRNGDPMLANLSDSDWQNAQEGAVAVFGEDGGCQSLSPDINACDPEQSLEAYGRLYNGFAMTDERGLCPAGWHVSTDGDWMDMEIALGMTAEEASSTGARGTDQAEQLKATYGWYNDGQGTNTSGFTAVPGSYRSANGYFAAGGAYAWFWTSTPAGDGTEFFTREFDWNPFVKRNENGVCCGGYSVRCVLDPG
jgi:uncharacterized protein (TIGR02145 family)